MKRIVSVWFPHWPMERLRRAAPAAVPADEPFALVETGTNGVRIFSVNRLAAKAGVRPLQPLADARAMLPGLRSRPSQPEADQAALEALARWCGRYGPQRNVCGRDGLWIDITGVAHLFGGEEGLLRDLSSRIEALGMTVRLAIADSHGAAFALARSLGTSFERAPLEAGGPQVLPVCRFTIAAPHATRSALVDVPVPLLRIAPDACVVLRRLGLFRIGQLYGLPRAGLAKRFREAPKTQGAMKPRLSQNEAAGLANDVLRRLDEALGVRHEPLVGVGEPALLRHCKAFTDPLLTVEGVMAETRCLIDRLMVDLEDKGLGARRVRLSLFRCDGTSADIGVGASAPCREAAHLLGLMSERLSGVNAGFGIDALAVDVLLADAMGHEQVAFSAAGGSSPDTLSRLIDRLSNRLDEGAVLQLEPVESHIPEAAQRCVPYRLEARPRASAGRHWAGRNLAGRNLAGRNLAGRNLADRASSSGATPPAVQRSSLSQSCPASDWPTPGHVRVPRPPLLLPRPEQIGVLAQIPEGAPRRFTWRRVVHDVLDAEGPERIAPEWWRSLFLPNGRGAWPNRLGDGGPAPGPADEVYRGTAGALAKLLSRPRDYYRVAVRGGASFWVFRAGLFTGQGLAAGDEALAEDLGDDGCTAAPVWFLHGLYG